MSQNSKSKEIGQGMYNSSITRVRPFFQALFKEDPNGVTWLPNLLKAMPLNKELAENLTKITTKICDEILETREYKDKILGEIELEECFEVRVPPSEGFLKWALEHSDALSWPDNGKRKYGDETQVLRERLFGGREDNDKTDTRNEGLKLLEKYGVSSSSGKWWAFEGFTEMDCLIETEDFLLGIEGKRTEFVSSSTSWYQDRNQVVRNIEVLHEIARKKNKNYAFILLSEDGIDPITKPHFEISMPHNKDLGEKLFSHYLGCLSWKEACKVTGIKFDELPENIRQIIDTGNENTKASQGDKTEQNDEVVSQKDYKLFRMHGRVAPQFGHYEAKLRNDLFMVGALQIKTGKKEHQRVRLIGYEVPLETENSVEYIDLLGYDNKYNLYIVELKTNNESNPVDVSTQLKGYRENVQKIIDSLEREVRDLLFLQDFYFSRKIIKLALVPHDFKITPNSESKWDHDVLVCSIDGRTDIGNLVENRGTFGFVTFNIKENKKQYLEMLSIV